MDMTTGWLVVAFLAATAHALYSPSDDVIELTSSNFQQKVIQSGDVWLVEFYAPWCGHCKNLVPEWKKAATALKGVAKVGAVDMTAHQSVGGPYNVRGFPTIKVFGLNKDKPEDYNGARSAQALVDSALQQVQKVVKARLSGKGGKSGGSGGSGGQGSGGSKPGNKDDVIELTDSNFEDQVLNSDDLWLVEFFAPWCGHCKRLEPEWASAATELKGKVKLGALDATVHTVMASRYQIQGFPTIKVFAAGKKDGDATDYQGGRTASDIVAYALDAHAENIPPPEVVEVVGSEVMKACAEKQLCVVSFLPHILDTGASGRNQYLEQLRMMGEKYKKKVWGWVWAEAGAQSALEEALGIGGFGYPAMAAVNSRKMKYATLKGSFSETGINEFLRELSVGRGSTAPVKGAALPEAQTIEPWDGQDGQLPEEEEWDLSDVELDDLDEDSKDEL
ncbi:protein disulfide-isomerase A6-like isoform X2 [Branchiostoma floridae]|uniref:Protein disulfide-isomerase A6 n=1 Tax=Branchiostoma floridae TaxID=7739 RepID=A0A9J7KET5_BRAFL|nr:protein disulfide-isomerase A6-like isoform X2 [Branchiostoma floridae]